MQQKIRLFVISCELICKLSGAAAP